MNMGKFSPVSLFFVCFQAVAAYVEPPANVTLSCHNLHNVVKWDYGPPQPGLQFKVHIGGLKSSPNDLLVNPPTKEADVSHLSDPSEDYFVHVTAVIGQNESYPAPPEGIIFSYFMDSQAERKCFVDFPSVNVTIQQDDKVLVRFTHPWLEYHRKLPGTSKTNSQKKRSHDAQISTQLPELKYDIVFNNKEQPERFFCEESVCEETLSVDPALEKHCLKVTGEMQKILVKGKHEYCTMPLKETTHKRNGHVYIVIGAVIPLALLMLGLVLFMVYKKKTTPSSALPDSMTFNGRVKQTLKLVREPVLVPEMGPTSPTPLLSDKEDKEGKEFTQPDTSSTEPVLRRPLGLSIEDEGVCDVVEEGNDEGTGYRQGRNLDEDETSLSGTPTGYEKRPVLVELAPDEQAEAYRG